MFGQMSVEPLIRLNGRGTVAPSLETAVVELLEATDHPKVVRWIQFPSAVLVFLVVPGDPESGAFYVYARRSGTWFWVDFEDSKFGGYNEGDFERLIGQSGFLKLVEKPWLLESEGKWFVRPGDALRCRFVCAQGGNA